MKRTIYKTICTLLSVLMLIGMLPASVSAMNLINEPLSDAYEIVANEGELLASIADSASIPSDIPAASSQSLFEDEAQGNIATPTNWQIESEAMGIKIDNGLIFPVTIVREGGRLSITRGVSNLRIEWVNGYDYNFPLAPGFPIYGKWCTYWADSQLVYCIEPRNLVSTDGKLLSTASDWDGLSFSQRFFVGYTLLYGNKDGNNIPEHIATQAILWEIALG